MNSWGPSSPFYRDPFRREAPGDYVVDISRPPIFPPTREMRDTFFGLIETQESQQRGERWNDYITRYHEALRQRGTLLSSTQS